MAKWVYVQAIVSSDVEDAVSFQHTIVDAESEQEAYQAGWVWAQGQPKVSVMNDLVVAVD